MLPETTKQPVESLPEGGEVRVVEEATKPAPEKGILGLQALPASGFRQAVREVGRGLAWVSYPVWKPIQLGLRAVGNDTRKILTAHRTSIAHLRGWRDRWRNDLKRWDGWTEEERRSVVRQQSVWGLLLFVFSFFALAVGGWPGYAPLLLFSLLWWMRSHDIKWLHWRWDVVRWGLGLPQVPYESTESNETTESKEATHG